MTQSATGATVHPAAICESADVGVGTVIGPFAVVHRGASIGRECVIGPGVVIDDGVRIGDGVTVESGVHVPAGTRLATGVVIGANTTIRQAVSIERNAVIRPGSVLSRNVPANAIVSGHPARIEGYVGVTVSPGDRLAEADAPPGHLVGGARFIRLRRAADLRGSLTALEFETDLPFVPRRVFSVFDVPSAEARGEHAHRTCHQLLICVRGAIQILIDDGRERSELSLSDPGVGLYLPPMVWGSQFGYSPDAILIALASHPYDPDDYVKDYDAFLELTAEKPTDGPGTVETS